VGIGGGACQKYGFKGEASQKNIVCKGGSPKKLPLSSVVTASVITQTSVPEGQK